jgi:hypothetical protein
LSTDPAAESLRQRKPPFVLETEAEPEEIPVHDGPDAHDWPEAAPKMWGLVLDLEYLDRIIAALDGPVLPEYGTAHEEARSFLDKARTDQRATLAAMILHAYRVKLPDEADTATEVVGGFHGDGDSTGDRDHL